MDPSNPNATVNANNIVPTFATFQLSVNNKGENIIEFYKQLCPDLHDTLLDITNNEHFYNDVTSMTPDYLFQYMKEMQTRAENGNEYLIELVIYLSELYKEKLQQFSKMNDDGKSTFDNLINIFTIGSKFVTTVNGHLVGGIVHGANYQLGSFGMRYFIINTLNIVSEGSNFKQTHQDHNIAQFGGLKKITDLDIRPLADSDEEMKVLTERGKRFLRYGKGVQYVAYNGDMYVNTMYGPMHFNARGRVMLDPIGYKIENPNHDRMHHGEPKMIMSDIPDDLLFMTSPFMIGFSFSAKRWGHVYVDCVADIVFDDRAYDYLVLDQDKKEIVKALVMYSGTGVTDVITGKSGGTIFLLHGDPGTGKTLTCEAIAELLHKPLYSITVGELGTSAKELEAKLNKILEIANSWKSVILIDEADIFLEKRTDNDIERNAMVGIFLRLLERHQGVMFLTTNRANCIDDAFRSRISITLRYNKLNEHTRYNVWRNLLEFSSINISSAEINILSKYEINGRQIKNIIRMSQSWALANKSSVSFDHLNAIVQYNL